MLETPVFGGPNPAIQYSERRAAYAVITSGERVAVVVGLAPVGWPAGARNGFRWNRRSPTEWVAVIVPAPGSASGPVTYQMRRAP